MTTLPPSVHCSYHKCLTKYFARVMARTFRLTGQPRFGYRHFKSQLPRFSECARAYRLASINNHALELGTVGDLRVSRFIRDPRDLVVSGYFYHLRSDERWCHVVDPSAADWSVVNGQRPPAMPSNLSFARWLASLPKDVGLMAEIDFRLHHFRSMLDWPADDPRVLTLRYEDILGREGEAFEAVARFHRLGIVRSTLARLIAEHLARKRIRGKVPHVRDSRPGQWREHFSPAVEAYFDEQHPGLVTALGYCRA